MIFTTETALKNYTKLMMPSIKRERKLSFFDDNSVSGRQSLHFLERQGAKEKPAQRVLMSG